MDILSCSFLLQFKGISALDLPDYIPEQILGGNVNIT